MSAIRARKRRVSAIRRAVILTAVCLAGCGPLSRPVSFDAAISAAELGDSAALRAAAKRLNEGAAATCVSYRFFDLLQSVATYRASAKTAGDAAIFLSTAGSSIYENEGSRLIRRSCDAPKVEAAFMGALPRLKAMLDATEAQACEAILNHGVSHGIAVDIALGEERSGFGKARSFQCQSQSTATEEDVRAYVRSFDYASPDPGRLVDCETEITERRLDDAYPKDMKALGRPKAIWVNEDGVSASWGHNYGLFVGVSPNLIRRTQGGFPSFDLLTRITENDGPHFTRQARETMSRSCLTDEELGRIMINVANGLGE